MSYLLRRPQVDPMQVDWNDPLNKGLVFYAPIAPESRGGSWTDVVSGTQSIPQSSSSTLNQAAMIPIAGKSDTPEALRCMGGLSPDWGDAVHVHERWENLSNDGNTSVANQLNYTFTMWAKTNPSFTSHNEYLIMLGEGVAGDILLTRLTSTNGLYVFSTANGYPSVGVNNFFDTTYGANWRWLAVTVEGLPAVGASGTAPVKFYRDGKLLNSTSLTLSGSQPRSGDSTGSVSIGNRDDMARDLQGGIAEVRVYNRVLSENELGKVFRQTAMHPHEKYLTTGRRFFIFETGTASGSASIAPSQCSHVQQSSASSVSSTASVACQSATHSHTASVATLSSSVAIGSNSSSHLHSADAVSTSATVSVTPDPAAHSHQTNEPALATTQSVLAGGAAHAHAADSASVAATVSVNATTATHDHTSQQPSVGFSVFVAGHKATHSHSADVTTLSITSNVATNAALHAHSAQSASSGITKNIAPSDSLHNHSAASAAVSAYQEVVLNGADHNHSASSPVLALTVALAVASANHSHATGVPLVEDDDGSIRDYRPNLPQKTSPYLPEQASLNAGYQPSRNNSTTPYRPNKSDTL